MKKAYLSLGSNLGDREGHLEVALERIAAAGIRILRRSSIYETEPQDVEHQPFFLNMAVEIESEGFPLQLLTKLHRIERELGRKRVAPKGPRTIDIDILFIGRFVIETRELQVPHPRLENRRFVLEPMAELAPDFRHPGSQKTIREMLAQVTGQRVKLWRAKKEPGAGRAPG